MVFLTPNGCLNGDAAIYADQIQRLDLKCRTIHIGYFIIGILFTRIIDLPIDYELNIMNCLFSALCIGLISLITWTLTGKELATITSSLTLIIFYSFNFNSLYAEVYSPQLFFFLLAVQTLLWNKSIISGISLALAFLITPSTIFYIPFLILLKPKIRTILIWFITFLLIVIIVLSPVYKEFLFSSRGIFSAFGKSLGFINALQKEINDLYNWNGILVFIVAGLFYLLISKEKRLFCAALFALWFFPFLLGEKYREVPVQLPFYAMLSVVSGIGFEYLLYSFKNKRLFKLSVILFFIISLLFSGRITYLKLAKQNKQIIDYRKNIFKLHQAAEPDYLVLCSWSNGVVFSHYIWGKIYSGKWINSQCLIGKCGDEHKIKDWSLLEKSMTQKKQIWVLEKPLPEILTALSLNNYSILKTFGGFHLANYYQ